MRQPSQRGSEHIPGRSFEHPERPFGDELLEQSMPSNESPEGGFYGRSSVGAPHEGARVHGVAERAKAIAVMRKADELMATDNPPATSPENVRRALELASGRVGLKIEEYDALVRGDPELVQLERQVIENALRRQG
jgi:hypothetical protein